MLLTLGKDNNPDDILELSFALEDHGFMPKWIERFEHAKKLNIPISEPDWSCRNMGSWTEETLIELLNGQIEDVNKIMPGVLDRFLDDVNDQNTLNYLHDVFVRESRIIDDKWNGLKRSGKLTENYHKEVLKIRLTLSPVNQTIHKIETFGGTPRIRVAWLELQSYARPEFDTEDYDYFTDVNEYGDVKLLYANIGKPLIELARKKDNLIEQFLSNENYSCDFSIGFSERSLDDVKKSRQVAREYFFENEQFFKNKGYEWGDPRLTLGSIKVASLIHNENKREQITENVKTYDHILDVILV